MNFAYGYLISRMLADRRGVTDPNERNRIGLTGAVLGASPVGLVVADQLAQRSASAAAPPPAAAPATGPAPAADPLDNACTQLRNAGMALGETLFRDVRARKELEAAMAKPDEALDKRKTVLEDGIELQEEQLAHMEEIYKEGCAGENDALGDFCRQLDQNRRRLADALERDRKALDDVERAIAKRDEDLAKQKDALDERIRAEEAQLRRIGEMFTRGCGGMRVATS